MRIAVYAGSFDPFTRGHGSVLLGALKAFDRVVIAIGRNTMKSGFLTVPDREQIIARILEDDLDVFPPYRKPAVETFEGLLVTFCQELLYRHFENELPDSVTIVRGLRAVSDLESEMAIADANRHISPRFQTVFIPTEADLAFVSSSMVREMLRQKVPKEILSRQYLYPSTVRRFIPDGLR